MAHNKKGVTAITGMILVILAVAIIVPAIIVGLDSPQETVLSQTEGERMGLTGTITTEATEINNTVNVTLIDGNTGNTASTGTISEGSNTTVTINGENVTVEVLDIVSDSEAIIQYTYETYIGFPDNAAILFENLALLLIVATFIMMAGVLLVITEVYD